MNAADPTTVARAIEAILLVSGRPVPVKTLASVTEAPENEVEAALASLEDRYSAFASGIALRKVAGGFQFSTSAGCAEVVERFRKEARPSPLSSAAHEVLSCALYLGPLTRAAVSRVRGVNSDAVVRNLIERNLLAESGHDSESPGSPALLDITEEFMISSGANDRNDFPPLETLVSEEELDRVRERVSIGAPDRPPEDADGDPET